MSGSSAGSGGGAAAAALRAAASAGDVAACTRYLGAARCVRFSRDETGRSALHLAASAGHGAVVRLLLNVAAPKEVDSPDGGGCTALQRAAADGHEEVLRLLLARGADVDKQDSVHGNSALHEAAWKGYSRSVRLLAAAGATLSRANAGGFTALHLCCQNGHNQSCRELLLAGCDPDIQNNYGDTALHTAARYGHAGVTRILISAQCRVSEQNKNGDTALHIAAAMGRRKLTRILLEAGCDKSVRNKQNETARDIALRKDLNEILTILDECVAKKDKKGKSKKRSKSKVRFDPKHNSDIVNRIEKPRHWSPYGCHYYPDPEAFPSPRLDSLPQEPLKRGEQYYLDLAGNIRKGPVGVGYTCYCAPLFRHLEARLERDKRELQRAQVRLGQRVAGLEQKLNRGAHGRRSERIISNPIQEPQLPRSRSLEMLDKLERAPMQAARSLDELDPPEAEEAEQRPSVKELVARIQQQTSAQNNTGNNSESSDDEDSPMRMTQFKGPMGDSNLASPMPNYENVPNDAPRSRSGVYSPTVINTALVDSNSRYIEPIVKIQESNIRYNDTYSRNVPSTSHHDPNYRLHYYDNEIASKKYYDLNSRFAKLGKTGLEGARMLDSSKMFESTTRMLENPQDTADRDTNNDSGYSTKVYGSSKGNSPSLSGQIDNECLGASSLV
ncbi:ankyrin repeat domain-containing protein 6 isoform X2 [Tribolium castaneum]|nr:PREDICTED: ankyrin repeat domain-containing protein 6 isoform X2 [Tribolium castaneum]|eukprot:XP_015838486.1 PREDICTED: ankyrin repeat domain-containing protein 6 isoform X2 [Tribolium castaneum]